MSGCMSTNERHTSIEILSLFPSTVKDLFRLVERKADVVVCLLLEDTTPLVVGNAKGGDRSPRSMSDNAIRTGGTSVYREDGGKSHR